MQLADSRHSTIGFLRGGGDSPNLPQSSQTESLGFPRNTPFPWFHPGTLKNQSFSTAPEIDLSSFSLQVFTKNMTQKDAPMVTARGPQISRKMFTDVFSSQKRCALCFLFFCVESDDDERTF